jgi:hypothetical protein
LALVLRGPGDVRHGLDRVSQIDLCVNRKLAVYSRVTAAVRRVSRGRLGRFPFIIKAKARFERGR